jgi:hypothetical protein
MTQFPDAKLAAFPVSEARKFPESFSHPPSLNHRTVMKRQLLALTLFLSALLPVSSRADSEVSFQFFYDNLSPHGEWVDVGDYGTCWRPNNVNDDWSPYTDGYWSYTDAGWTWVSYEDFGDICYHYGRWVRADEVGWCWVPDYEWGPAWVSWRSDDDYIGWAPLPPEAHWRSSVGFSVWVDDYCDIGPAYYNFCPIVEFSAPVLSHVCVPRVGIVNIFAHTVNITNICFNSYNNVPFCGGPNFAFISGRVRRPVPALKLVQNTTIVNNNYTVINNRRVLQAPRNTVAGNTLNVFAPKVIKNTENLIKPQVTKVVAKDKVKRGWDLVKDQGEVQQLREKVKNQSKGLNPDTAPAKPVQIADLKPLPEKADPKAPSPVARPNRLAKDRDNDGIPDRKDKNIAGQPGIDRPGAPEGRPKKGNKADGQPDSPAVGVNPERPDAPDRPDKPGKGGGRPGKPDRIAGEQPAQPAQPETLDDKLNRKGQGGLRKPFKEGRPENPVANDQPPVRPNPEAPDREPGGGKGKGKKAQADAAEEIERQQQRQRIAEQQEAQRDQAERQQRQQNAARLERQRQEQQGEAQGRRQQLEAERDRAERQQAVEAERQQQAEHQARQQQRALEAQRQQQAQRQFELQQQRQQQAREQQRPQPQVQQGPQRQIQNPNNGGGNGGGNGRGKGRQLTPEEAQELRRAQRGY